MILNVKIKLEVKEVYRENTATLNTSNEGKSTKIFGVILTESKGTIQKILEKTIKTHTTINKIQIKMTPVVLKVTSILVPGTAPVILPLYNFLKTDQGKKMLEMGLINQEIMLVETKKLQQKCSKVILI